MSKAADDYDEDFEAYEDDFEEAVESPHKTPAVVSSSSSSSSSSQAKEATISRDENKTKSSDSKALAADSKHDSKDTANNDTNNKTNNNSNSPDSKAKDLSLLKSKKTKKFGSSSISLAGGALSGMGTRSKRLARMLASGVLDLQDEKFNQLNIVPSSKYDVYQRMLHGAGAPMRQVGVPTDESSRDVLCGTDPIVMTDKEMQFSYGDDTALLNIMRVIQKRNEGGRRSSSDGPSILQEAGVAMSSGTTTSEGGVAGTSLVRFVQLSSQLCLALLEEQNGVARDRQRRGERDVGSKGDSAIFATGSKWEALGQAAANGANELVRTRKVSSVKFSSLQPHVLMSSHPPPNIDEDPEGEDLRPLKGLYCLWDVSLPGQPSFVLEASGSPSCCCPSAAQSYIFAAGTAEGSVHLWDLREDPSLHRDSDSVDLGIEKGIRRPCYSAHLALTTGGDVDSEQHSAGVVQIEPLGEATLDSGSSQFVTLDADGTVALWATAQADARAVSATDFGLSPWGTVRLLHMRSLRLGQSSPSTVLATVPGDTSLLLASAEQGCVRKLSRYGEPAAPLNLSRPGVYHNHYSSAVTCIAVRPRWLPLVLVGREDGSLDLFSLDKEAPLSSWTMSHHLVDSSNSCLRASSLPVVALRWCSERATSFVACDAGGLCQLFDLRLKPDAPLFLERITTVKDKSPSLRARVVDFSHLRPGGRIMRAAAVISGAVISVNSMNEELFALPHSEEDERQFQSSMDEWMALQTSVGMRLVDPERRK